MTVIRVGSKILHNDGVGTAGWFFVESKAGVNVSWSDPPRGESVCIPHDVWKQMIGMWTSSTMSEPEPKKKRKKATVEAVAPKKKRKRKQPGSKIQMKDAGS